MQNHQWAGFFRWVDTTDDEDLRARKARVIGVLDELDPKGQAAADARTMVRAIDEQLLANAEARMASASLEERKKCYSELLQEFFPRGPAAQTVRRAIKNIDAQLLERLNPGRDSGGQ